MSEIRMGYCKILGVTNFSFGENIFLFGVLGARLFMNKKQGKNVHCSCPVDYLQIKEFCYFIITFFTSFPCLRINNPLVSGVTSRPCRSKKRAEASDCVAVSA